MILNVLLIKEKSFRRSCLIILKLDDFEKRNGNIYFYQVIKKIKLLKSMIQGKAFLYFK